jgi:hypothetical protein
LTGKHKPGPLPKAGPPRYSTIGDYERAMTAIHAIPGVQHHRWPFVWIGEPGKERKYIPKSKRR